MRTIDALPYELRRGIAILVLNHSWHDLASLSRTSGTWYTIAVPELYHDLNLKFHDCSSFFSINGEIPGQPSCLYSKLGQLKTASCRLI
ncbi:hypothetical protein BO86DRAFT_226389 [Aspergillus japonicus CBS 114.51]|uniref:F-box domain-containing protein n=1 Tax=Aspergillus japonicus CBS 114.51 TaxID=1448312 RepID=A0A8T8WMY9_ASPJA|nr:hypothetical protein BO86DRAFT_226389 [Aspergillus japonicus CBS 114.51]RAH77156.1 hypothetical protein BO86DRAFT_226389 [Aspergillus japonicus CBS 114.51]